MSHHCILIVGDSGKSAASRLRGVQLCRVCSPGEATCGGLCHPWRLCNTVTGSLIHERVGFGGESSVKDHKYDKGTTVSFQWAETDTWFDILGR